jgi:hypothetical protein
VPRLVLSLLTLLLWAAVARQADACSCVARSPCQTFASADAIFVGDVVGVDAGPRGRVGRLRVTHVFKGAVTVGATVPVQPGFASCGVDFAPGQRWVMFAGKEVAGFSTNQCSGSSLLAAGAPIPKLPPPAGEVSGSLQRYPRGAGAPSPVAGIAVWVQTPGGRLASRTAADGSFTLRGVPPGAWTLSFDLGPRESADQPIELGANDCETVFASPRPK